MPRKLSAGSAAGLARALSYALVQVRPEAEGSEPWAEKKYRAQYAQWEMDVLAVSAVLFEGLRYDDSHFRRMCNGPKDRGENP